MRYDRFESGYQLYYNGKRGFVSISELVALIQQHKFNQENENMNTTKFANTSNKLKSGDYIIGSQLKSDGSVSFSTNPAIQSSLAVARTEATRLAKIDNSKRFMVLEVKGVAEVQDIVWS